MSLALNACINGGSLSRRGLKVACASLFAAAVLLAVLLEPLAGLRAADAEAAGPNRWYLAEGYTGRGFQEYVSVGNAGSTEASVTVTFLFNGARPIDLSYTVPAGSRHTVDVNRVVGPGREVSVVVSSVSPDIAVERAVYFEYGGRPPGSHIAQAAAASSRTWYFAEGYTGPGFDEYVTVLNPGTAPAALTFEIQASCGFEVRSGLSVGSNSRRTFRVNDLAGPDKHLSVKLNSDQPVVAERPMYFEYLGVDGQRWAGGHCVMGATSLEKQYLFAEGTTRPGFDQWLTIQNPNEVPINVTATYQFGPWQGAPATRSYRVDGRRRFTVFVPAEVGPGKDVSARLTSSTPFLAERPLYYGYTRPGLAFQGGHCAIGSPAPRGQWFLAEGYTGPGFEQWFCIQNTSGVESTVDVEYFTQEGGALPPRTVKVPANTRVTILVNEHAGPGLQLASRLTVSAGPDVVVERPIYFDSSLGMPGVGGSGVLFGMCFSPYLTEDPLNGGWVTVERVAYLMDRIAPYTRWIRTFCSQGEWDAMPRLAIERGLRVAAGCDLHTGLDRNQKEVDSLIAQVERGEVDLACVGDEALLAKALSEDQLIGYIRQVKATGVPTTTSEAWNVLLAHPRLAAECDVITANIFPYWEGVPVERAVAYLDYCYREVQKFAPGKKVIVETGWPSGGQVVGGAVPNPANAARYLDEFMRWAYDNGVEYFYFEAFDELWKDCREGPCGSNWGLWTVDASVKPEVGQVVQTWR